MSMFRFLLIVLGIFFAGAVEEVEFDFSGNNRYAPLENRKLALHIELDFGHSIPEIRCKLSKQHFKTFPNAVLFHIHCTQLGHVCFYGSEDVGGKGANEALTCFWLFLCMFSCGCGGLTISSDTCASKKLKRIFYYFSTRLKGVVGRKTY